MLALKVSGLRDSQIAKKLNVKLVTVKSDLAAGLEQRLSERPTPQQERELHLLKLERMIGKYTKRAEKEVTVLDRWIVLMRAYSRIKRFTDPTVVQHQHAGTHKITVEYIRPPDGHDVIETTGKVVDDQAGSNGASDPKALPAAQPETLPDTVGNEYALIEITHEGKTMLVRFGISRSRMIELIEARANDPKRALSIERAILSGNRY